MLNALCFVGGLLMGFIVTSVGYHMASHDEISDAYRDGYEDGLQDGLEARKDGT